MLRVACNPNCPNYSIKLETYTVPSQTVLIHVKLKILANTTKIFEALHGFAKRALIGFRINKML